VDNSAEARKGAPEASCHNPEGQGLRSLTVVQLAPLFDPLRDDVSYGSIERMARCLDVGLVNLQHRSIMLALEGSQAAGELLAVGRPHDYVEQARVAVQVAISEEADVIQTHRREFFELGEARRLLRLRPQIKIVSTLHGPPGKILKYYSRHDAVAHFIFVSKAQASGLPGLSGSVIHNAVDVESVPFREAASKPGYLVFLGRVCAEKGVTAAIELARRAELPLKIAGVVMPGDQMFFETAIAPELCPGRVEYLGPVNDAEKYELLGQSTALVLLPEYEDPCPLVAIEALAAGVPVLALARGGLAELVDDRVTGLIAPDIAGLCGKLADLAAIDRRRCRFVAAEKFDARRMVGEYLAVYLGTRQPWSASDR
jgi:glycosyltransferase involved in cell wall biosynthesis